MKNIKTIKSIAIGTLIGLLVICAGVVWYLTSHLDSLVAQALPKIEKKLADAVGTSASIGSASATLFPTLAVRVNDVVLGKRSQAAESLQLQEATLGVQLRALLNRQIKITEVTLHQPRFVIVRTSDGIQIAGLPKKARQKKRASRGAEKSRKGEVGSQTERTPPKELPVSLTLDNIAIDEGQILFKDNVQSVTTELTDITVRAAVAAGDQGVTVKRLHIDSTLGEDAALQVKVPTLTMSPDFTTIAWEDTALSLNNSSITLSGRYDMQAQAGTISAKAAAFNLSPLIEVAKPYVQGLADRTPELSLSLKIDANLLRGKLPEVAGHVTLVDGSMTLPNGTVTVPNLPVQLTAKDGLQHITVDKGSLVLNGAAISLLIDSRLSSKQFVLSNATVLGFGGTIEAQSQFTFESRAFQSQLDLKDIELAQVFAAALKKAAPVEGRLSELTATISGTTGADMKESLSGHAEFILHEGRIKEVNLLHAALKDIAAATMTPEELEEIAPPSLEPFISSTDTPIDEATGRLTFESEKVSIESAALRNQAFLLTAHGSAGFGGTVAIKSEMMILPPASSGIARRVKELSSALDSQERLALPLDIRGKAPSISVGVDLQQLLKSGAGNVLREKAADALQDFLGGL